MLTGAPTRCELTPHPRKLWQSFGEQSAKAQMKSACASVAGRGRPVGPAAPSKLQVRPHLATGRQGEDQQRMPQLARVLLPEKAGGSGTYALKALYTP